MKGNRALLRLAWRQACRHRRRSILVMVLVALPVAVAAGGVTGFATVQRTVAEERSQMFGQADLIAYSPAPGGAGEGEVAPPDGLPVGARTVPMTWDTAGSIVVDGRAPEAVYTRHTDPGDPVNDGVFRLESGRFQQALDEVTISPALADELDVSLGDTVEMLPSGVRRTVVGTVSELRALDDPLLVRLPDGGPVRQWRIDLPDGTDASHVAADLRGPWRVEVADEWRPDEDATGRAVAVSGAYLAGVFIFVWTGVVAAAALSIGFRRQLRDVGLLAINGGDRGQVGRFLLVHAALLGLGGSLAGVAVGIAASQVAVDRLEDARLLDGAAGPLRLPVLALGGTLLLGVGCSVVAGLRPALRAARIPTTAALQGRMPRAPRYGRSILAGSLLGAIGVALIVNGATGAMSSPGDATMDIVSVAAGAASIAVAAALLNRFAVAAAERLTCRAGLSLRFATRDASRNAQRTGPAIVAAMLALAGTAGTLVLSATFNSEDELRTATSGRDEHLVLSWKPGSASWQPRDLPRLAGALRTAIGDALPDADVAVSTSPDTIDGGRPANVRGTLSVDVGLHRRPIEVDGQRVRAAALRALPPGSATQLFVTGPDGAQGFDATLAAVALGTAVSLLVLGLVAALNRSEIRHEMAMLQVMGMSRRQRRRLAGAAAGLLALVAGVLAVPAGVVPAAAFLRARDVDVGGVQPPIVIPWGVILTVVVGVTLVLAVGGWLTGGSHRKTVHHSG